MVFEASKSSAGSKRARDRSREERIPAVIIVGLRSCEAANEENTDWINFSDVSVCLEPVGTKVLGTKYSLAVAAMTNKWVAKQDKPKQSKITLFRKMFNIHLFK
jgi:hypothetical protein